MTKEREESAQSPAAFASRFHTEIKTGNRERRSASRRLALAQTAAGSGRNDLLPPLELVDVRLDDLKLSQRRLRKRDPAHIREVTNSIARLGYSKPILIGPDNEVIDGETVIEGVRLLGLDRLSCIRVAHLNDSERRLLRLAINRSSAARCALPAKFLSDHACADAPARPQSPSKGFSQYKRLGPVFS